MIIVLSATESEQHKFVYHELLAVYCSYHSLVVLPVDSSLNNLLLGNEYKPELCKDIIKLKCDNDFTLMTTIQKQNNFRKLFL